MRIQPKWGELSESVRYNTCYFKCTNIRNPCIRVAQHNLICCFFTRDDSLNVPRLSKLNFKSCILDGVQTDPGAFLAWELHSTAIITKGKIVIGGIITTIARFLSVEPNPKDRIFGSKRLDQAAFELMNFCKAEVGHLCWIYHGDWLPPLPNVDRTTLLY